MLSNKIAAVAAVVAVLSVGWLLIRPTADTAATAPAASTSTPQTASAGQADSLGPTAEAPLATPEVVGDEAARLTAAAANTDRTETGALTAARLFIEMGEPAATLNPDAIAELWHAIAVPDAADQLIAEQMATVDQIRAQYPTGIPTRLIPLETRVGHFDPDRAVIDLWVLAIYEVPNGHAGQSWFTATYDLHWHDKQWRIANTAVTEGPTPALDPTTLTASSLVLNTALAGFDDPWRG